VIRKIFKYLFLITFLAVDLFAEQYEATFIPSRSLLYRNTFGLFYDEYDYIVNPRLSAYIKGHRLITNLTNLNGPDRFEIGYSGNYKFGTFTFTFLRDVHSQDSSYATRTIQATDSNSDGVNDIIKEIDENKYVVDSNGQSLPYLNENNYDIFLGWGKPFSDRMHIGAGIGLRSLKKKEAYNGYEPGLTSRGVYGFGSSPLLTRETKDIILFPEVITTRVVQEREDGILSDKQDEVSLVLGTDYRIMEQFSISIDLLLGLRSERKKGSGSYTYEETINGYVSDKEALGDITDISLNKNRLGFAIEGVYAPSTETSLNIDTGFEASRGDNRRNTLTESYSTENTAPMGAWGIHNEEAKTVADGDSDKYRLFTISIRGRTGIFEDVIFGIGVEYTYNEQYNYSATTFSRYTVNDVFNDGDNQDMDGEASIYGSIIDKEITHTISIPAGIRYKVSKRIELNLGARHSIRRIKNYLSRTYKASSIYTYEKVRGNGVVEKVSDSPVAGFPGRNSNFIPDIKSSDIKTESFTDLAFGIGFYATENLIFRLLFSESLNSIYGDKIDITNLHLSCVLAF